MFGFKKTAKKKVLRVGVLSPVAELNPHEAQDYTSVLALNQVFESPGDDVPGIPSILKGGLRPENGNPAIYSAPVREGVRFSNGTAVNAQHVVTALQRVESLVKHARVYTKDGRVCVALKEGTPRFDLKLRHHRYAVTLREGSSLLGTGPFMIAGETANGGLELVRNPHYRGTVHLDGVELVVYPPDSDGQPRRLLEAVADGQVDFTDQLTRDSMAGLKGVAKKYEPGSATGILFMNTQSPALRQVEARRALALAIDRRKVTAECYKMPLAYTAASLLPPAMSKWRDGLYPNVLAAKEALAALGGDAPRRLSLYAYSDPRLYLPRPQATARMIAEELAALGIKVEPHFATDWDEYYKVTESGNYDMMLSGWIADTTDPADFFEALLASWSVPMPGRPRSNAANECRFTSDEMDEAIRRCRTEATEEATHAALALVARDVPLLPLMYGPAVVAHAFAVKNYTFSALGRPLFHDVDLDRR